MLNLLKGKDVVIKVKQNWFGNSNIKTVICTPLTFCEDDDKIILLVNNNPRIIITKDEIIQIHKHKNCVVFETANQLITIKKETILDRIKYKDLRY